MLHAHALVPGMEVLEHERHQLQAMEGCRVGYAEGFGEDQQPEQVLLPALTAALLTPKRRSIGCIEECLDALSQ